MRFLSLLIIAAINFALIVNHDTMAADNFAIEFDGDNQKRVQAPHSDSVNIDGHLTMEAWVFPTEATDGGIVINKENSWECGVKQSILKAAIWAAEWAWHGGGEVPNNRWTFVAVTFDNKEHHTFVNGKYQASRANKGKIQLTDLGFHVGWRPLHGSEPFIGIIDEVRVSNVVRYQKNKNFDVPDREFMPDDDTVVLYHFNEGKGKVTEDASKFKNDGTLEGGAKFVKSEAPIKPAPIEPRGKLTTMWAQVRADP